MKTVSFVAMLGATSAKWGMGECPIVESLSDIDMPAYSGKWYEVYRDKHNFHEHFADCVTKEYEMNKAGNMDLYFRGYWNAFGWGKYGGIGGEVSDCGTNGLSDSTCMARFDKGWHKKTKHPLDVLATDNESYDIGYFCWSFKGLFHVSNLSIFSRTPVMSEEVQEEVKTVIHDKLPHYDLSQGMYWTKQGEDKCNYKWLSANGTKPVEW